MLKLHPAPTAIGEASINVQLSRNESDDQLVKRFFDAFDGWERNSPYYWGGSIFFRPGGLSATLKKYGPIDEKSESELKPFYDLQTLYPDPAKVTINLVNLTSYMAGGSWRFGFYTAGALIPPEKHNDGLWEFLKQEVVMSKSNGHIFCFLNRLGGEWRTAVESLCIVLYVYYSHLYSRWNRTTHKHKKSYLLNSIFKIFAI